MTEHQTILPVGEEALRAAARTIGGSAAWAVAEIERLRAALRSALAEIEDAGPKALKYAEQEIRKGLADG